MEPQIGAPPAVKYTIPVGGMVGSLLFKVAVIVIVTGVPSGTGLGLADTVKDVI